MKKGLINEAFRLQQLAGLKPVNELFGDANPDALKLDEGTIRRYFETMVESQPGTVVNILTQLMTEKLPFNQFLHDTVEDISDSYRDELGETEGLQNEAKGGSILILKDLYYFDKLNMIAAMSDVDSKYEDYGSIVFEKGDVINPGTEEYDMILDSPSLKANVHYK
jgi:hypothetical protein